METNNTDSQDLDYQEDLTIFWKAFSFLIPIVGIVIYFVQNNKGATLKAKSGLIAAGAGMILNILTILMKKYF